MGIVELNHQLGLNLGIPANRHCYVMAKSTGRQGRYFLRAKDVDHHLVTMLASSGKRVDDVMVIVRGNWEFGEGEDRQDPVPRQQGEPGDQFELLTCLKMNGLFNLNIVLITCVSCRQRLEKSIDIRGRSHFGAG